MNASASREAIDTAEDRDLFRKAMAEIGLVLDLSESRVSQIHKDVIARLRRRFKDEAAEMVA